MWRNVTGAKRGGEYAENHNITMYWKRMLADVHCPDVRLIG